MFPSGPRARPPRSTSGSSGGGRQPVGVAMPPAAAGFVDQLVQEYQPLLRLVFRNFPLTKHRHARAAALAAEAAGLQGKFWEMHDLLYREQLAWSEADQPGKLRRNPGTRSRKIQKRYRGRESQRASRC